MRGLIRRIPGRVAAAAAAGVLAAGTLVAAAAGTGVAAAATTMSAAEAVLPGNAASSPFASLQSVSCASAGNCTAVGTYSDSSGGTQGLLLTQTGGTWAAGTEAVLPAGTAPNPDVNLISVSCASAGNCTAVGTYSDSSNGTQGLLLTQTNGTWAAGTEAVLPAGAASNPEILLFSVSCASAGNCTAAGQYVDNSGDAQGLLLTQTGGTWAATEAVPPANAGSDPLAGLTSVSCASAGNCTAVGSYSDSSGTHQGMLLTKTAGTWAAGTEATLPAGAAFNPFANLISVSCASAGNCTAVGTYTDSSRSTQGVMLTQAAGTWAAGIEATLPADAGASPQAVLSSVSCASAGNCTATGGYADSSGGNQSVLLTQTAGTWTAGAEAVPPAGAGTNPNVGAGPVSCASAGNCTAAGDYTDSSGSVQAMLLTQTAGTWAAGTEVAAPAGAAANPFAFPNSVSCASAGNCSAVGSYTDTSGSTQGLLLTQTTPIPTCPGSGLLIGNQAPSQTGTPGIAGSWS